MSRASCCFLVVIDRPPLRVGTNRRLEARIVADRPPELRPGQPEPERVVGDHEAAGGHTVADEIEDATTSARPARRMFSRASAATGGS